MADDSPRISINGVDLSAFVKDIQFDPASLDEPFGPIGLIGDLKARGTITIQGYFVDADSYVCDLCHRQAKRMPSGDPVLRHPSMPDLAVCGDCLVPLIEQGIVAD